MKKKNRLSIVYLFLFLCLLSVKDVAFAGISADLNSYVFQKSATWKSKSYIGDVYIPKGITLTTAGKTTIYGDIYVLGTLKNTGTLTVEGTLNCLNYSDGKTTHSYGKYSYGFVKSTGKLQLAKLNIKNDYLKKPIPLLHTHTWKVLELKKESCEKNWVKWYYCPICSAETKKNVTPTGHIFYPWYTNSAPSCGRSGYKTRDCKECGYEEKVVLKATGKHIWSAWSKEEPDCLNDGRATRYCVECSKTQTKVLPATPDHHDLSSWKVHKRATALASGQKIRKCSICGYAQVKTLPKLKATVTLNKKAISLARNKSYTLYIDVKTYGDKISTWKSSNATIAAVNSAGKVTAKKKGTATITLYMKSGAKASCKVTVK